MNDGEKEFADIAITVDEGAFVPEYRTAGAAGADLRAFLDRVAVIPPGGRMSIPTGIRMAIPPGFEAQIRSRSGLALDRGVFCLNSPGTIDSDYRGEIRIILANFGDTPFEVRRGDRVAQIVLAAVEKATFVAVPGLSDTTRAEGGFGSTGGA
ncbi:MAG: dUTP diphosphatase [Spirochaetes bacterium]|nr:dUTP diphosphatase [Spirochaetota bacterium]